LAQTASFRVTFKDHEDLIRFLVFKINIHFISPIEASEPETRFSREFCEQMTETCATCGTRILCGEKKLRYYENDNGIDEIGNFATPVKRRDGALNYCCRDCHSKAENYV
jgi:hypothetical protein